jgi:predicted O-methyltransferase YrrM
MKKEIRKKRLIIDGEILPYYNHHVLDLLLDTKIAHWSVFEWGTGYSTVWFQNHVERIIATESNRRYYKSFLPLMKSNCLYMRRDLIKNKLCPYVNAIHESKEKYDCIIVDGRNRNLCIKQIPQYIKKNGLIILDNSDRKKYNNGKRFLNKHFKLYFNAPIDLKNKIYNWGTTVWINK